MLIQAPSPAPGSLNGLSFIKELKQNHYPVLGGAALRAFGKHCWYLSENMMGLAFFDPDVDLEQKGLMVKNLTEQTLPE